MLSHRYLLSIGAASLLVLTACPQTSVPTVPMSSINSSNPNPTQSETPTNPEESTGENTDPSPTSPSATSSPGGNTEGEDAGSGAGSISTIVSPEGAPRVALTEVKSIELNTTNRYMSDNGDTGQYSVTLRDASGQIVVVDDLELLWSSSNPDSISIDQNGLATALVDVGYTEITVRIDGSDLSATALVSVNSSDVFSSNNNGDNARKSSTPDPVDGLDVTLDFNGLGLGEFKIDVPTSGEQKVPQVAMDDAGNYTVVWEDGSGLDGGGTGIFGQRYRADGTPLGAQFQVNTHFEKSQSYADIAMDGNGNSIVVWQSKKQVNVNGFLINTIHGQRYDNNGNPVGDEFQISETLADKHDRPSVDMNSHGDFVVVWRVQEPTELSGNSNDVVARYYNADGSPDDDEFLVNSFTTSEQAQHSDVVINDEGEFIIIWQDNSTSNSDTWVKMYDSDKNPGSEFLANTTINKDQDDPKVAFLNDGNFVVAWEDNDGSSGDDIVFRIFDSSGSEVIGETSVNDYTSNNQRNVALAADADGNFVLAWESDDQDGDLIGTVARIYNSSGIALTDEFQVNNFTTANQYNMSAAMSPDGRVAIVWESDQEDPGPSSAIVGKLYDISGKVQ